MAPLARKALISLARWIGEPSQITNSLPRILREVQAQEPYDIFGPIGSILHLHQQTPVRGDPTDGGQMIPRQLHAQHRRLSDGGPGAYRHGQQIKARLIYPDNGALFLDGLFLSVGHVSLCQVAMACSSRCVARSIGCCTLRRIDRKRRLICPGW